MTSGPERRQTMFSRFTKDAINVFNVAQKELGRREHIYTEPGHILLGLISNSTNIAARLIAERADIGKIRSAIDSVIGESEITNLNTETGLTDESKRLIELAIDEARISNDGHIDTHHLLFGMIREGTDAASGVLKTFKITKEDLPELRERAKQLSEKRLRTDSEVLDEINSRLRDRDIDPKSKETLLAAKNVIIKLMQNLKEKQNPQGQP
jgi:ATP-dependent Clp protease ATP-binding subunit ClpA